MLIKYKYCFILKLEICFFRELDNGFFMQFLELICEYRNLKLAIIKGTVTNILLIQLQNNDNFSVLVVFIDLFNIN